MTLHKVSAKTAAEVCTTYPVSATAGGFIADRTPAQFAAALVQAERYRDVFDFLAHALPKRDAVWWACLALRHVLGPELPPKERAALKSTVEWVLEPEEPKRRAAQAAGEAADFATPAGCAALAAYGSGGSLIAANLPVVPPPNDMTARAVSGCLALLSARGDPSTFPLVQRELAELGLAIAEGKITWPVAARKS